MKFILGKKVNMTQIFGEDGVVRAATVLEVPETVIAQVKTVEKDGYNAVQVGSGTRKEKNISKPVRGHLKSVGPVSVLKEFRVENTGEMKVGDKIAADIFTVGEKVVVSALSKAKGFQGVVKRHGFHGGPRSHGQKHSEREPGSIGGGGRDGGRVAKGKRMAGRTGGDRITIKGLTVLQIDNESKTILVSGAVPGRRGTIVEVRGMN